MKLNTNNIKLNAFKNKKTFFPEFYLYLPFVKQSSAMALVDYNTTLKIKNKKKTKDIIKNFKIKLNSKKLTLKFFTSLFKG